MWHGNNCVPKGHILITRQRFENFPYMYLHFWYCMRDEWNALYQSKLCSCTYIDRLIKSRRLSRLVNGKKSAPMNCLDRTRRNFQVNIKASHHFCVGNCFRADLHGGVGFVICYFQAKGSDHLFGAARDWVRLLRGIGVQEYDWRGCLCRVLMRW